MKLPDGVTVYIGGKKIKGEIADKLAPKHLQKSEPKKPAEKKSESK